MELGFDTKCEIDVNISLIYFTVILFPNFTFLITSLMMFSLHDNFVDPFE